MEKIEVGEYVRINNDGRSCIGIGKIKKITKDNVYAKFNNKYDLPISFQINNITKHSKNIIDLIEVGDICMMKDRTYEFDEFDCVYIYDRSFIEAIKKDIKRGNKIISILTKEQYKNNCFEVVE